MAGPQDYLTVQGPSPASYQLPKFDLGSQIAQIPQSYQEGQQYGVKRALQTMFQNNPDLLKPDPTTGQLDLGAIATNAMKIGGPEAAAPFFNMMMQQQGSVDFNKMMGGGGGIEGQPQQPQSTSRPLAPNAATGPAGITGEHPNTGGGSIFPFTPGSSPPQIVGGGPAPSSGAGLGGQPAPFAGNRQTAFNDRIPQYGGMSNRPSPDQQNAPPGPVGGARTVAEDGTTGQPTAPTSAREVANNLPDISNDPIISRQRKIIDIASNFLGTHPMATPGQIAGAKATIDTAQEAVKQRTEFLNKIAIPPDAVRAARAAGFGNDVAAYEGSLAGGKKVGEAQGGVIAGYIDKGQSAYKRMQLLDTVGDALQRGGGNITTGPFAEASLRAKQAISSMFGIDLEGVPEAEVAQKTGFGLATQAVKEITSRPTQMEVKMALQNNPGLLLSPKGSAMMIDVMKQAARQDIDLSRLAQKPENQKNWPDVVDKYYASHPLLSPFDHKTPLGMKDVKAIGGAAAQAIPEGATATHPGTGARVIMQGGKWVPLKAGPST